LRTADFDPLRYEPCKPQAPSPAVELLI